MNKRIAWALGTLIVGLLLDAGPVSAAGRPTYCKSIEWLSADADVIVWGRLEAIDPPVEPGRPRRRRNEARIAVEETLKGPALDKITFTFTDGGEYNPARDQPWTWRAEQEELLFFLKRVGTTRAFAAGDRPPRDVLLLDYTAPTWSVIRLDGSTSPGTRQAATMDFKVLRCREDILTAAREGVAAVAERDHPPVRYRVEVPMGTELHPVRLGWGNFFEFTVPLDDRLERHARRWIQSDHPRVRLEGVKALSLFRSEENARLLEPLLDDKDIRTGERTADGRVRTIYPIAEEAARVLNEWGEDAEAPS